MKKNFITHKGVQIVVDNNSLRLEKDSKQLAICTNFLIKENLQEKDGQIAVKLTNRKGFLKDFGWMGLTKEQYQELIEIKENIKIEIATYFNNIEKAELKLINGMIRFIDENELKELNETYYNQLSQEWIKKNKKSFIQNEEIQTDDFGMNSTKITYTFTKENKEIVAEQIKEEEKTEEHIIKKEQEEKDDKLYQQLNKIAQDLSEEEFEDKTGRNKKDFI